MPQTPAGTDGDAPVSVARSGRTVAWRDLVLTGCLIALAMVVLGISSTFPEPPNSGPSPRFAPQVLAASLILLAILIGVRAFTLQETEAAEEETSWRVMMAVALFVGYAALLPYVGFVAVTPPFVFAVSFWLGGGLKRAIASALVTTLGVYVVFVLLLGVALPGGLLLGDLL